MEHLAGTSIGKRRWRRSAAPYRGADRRSRTSVAVSEPALPGVIFTALLVCASAAVPAVALLSDHPSSAMVESLLVVVASMVAVAAGGANLVSWRISGRASLGWHGSALVVLGVLSLAESVLGSFGFSTVATAVPADRLVPALIAGCVVWRGIRAAEVETTFTPVRTIAVSLATGLFVLGLLLRLEVLGILPAAASSPVCYAICDGASALVWTLAAGISLRGRRTSISGTFFWVMTLMGVSFVLAVLNAFVGSVVLLSTAVELIAMALAFGGGVRQLHDLIRGEDRRQVSLGLALDDSHRQSVIDHEGIEELLHDLRNAVAGLATAHSVLQESVDGPFSSAKQALASVVAAEIARLEALIEPERPVRVRQLSLEDVLGPVVEAERALGGEIELRVGHVTVRADADSLAEVVQNVLANARRYAPSAKVVLSAVARGDVVELSIRDDGPGILANERLDVFRRGVRGSTSAGTDGNGLGLFLARRTLQAMGCAIRLSTATGPGCCFVVTLPAGVPDTRAVALSALPFEPAPASAAAATGTFPADAGSSNSHWVPAS